MSQKTNASIIAIITSIIIQFMFISSVNAETSVNTLNLSDIESAFEDKEGRNIQLIDNKFCGLYKGNIFISEPFHIPCYDPDTDNIYTAPQLWNSVMYLDDKPIALLKMSYISGSLVFKSIIYLPDTITQGIENGNSFSLFLYDGSNTNPNGDYTYCYAIDKAADTQLLYTDDNKFDSGAKIFRADMDDYVLLSEINTINSSLKKQKMYDHDLKNKKAVFKNLSFQSLLFNEQTAFTLRTFKSDPKQIIISPFDDELVCLSALKCRTWDIKCIHGGINPQYIIALSDNPDMVLTFDGGNKPYVSVYSGENSQIWRIELK